MLPAAADLRRLLAGSRLPLVGAPMFLVSGPELVIAQCSSGIVGAFPALNARSSNELDEWIGRIRRHLASESCAPFAVNLIVNARNTRLEQDLDVCIRHEVPIVVTSMSSPEQIVPRVHAYGGFVMHDVVATRHARKAAVAGVDGLILVCAGAGGHTGSLNPFAFVNEVRQFFEGPLGLAGAITRGSDVAAARAMGYDFAYAGTRFIATQESSAPDAYKCMVVEAAADDIVCTSLFSGVKGNYLAASIRNAGLNPRDLPTQATPSGYRRRVDGPKAWRDIWGAGQGVGSIAGIPTTNELVHVLEREYRGALDRLAEQYGGGPTT